VLALFLTVGAAFLTGSAAMALAGACVAMAGSVVLAGRAWARRPRFDGADRAVALDCARYGAPIVAANILYVAITLTNRSLISDWYGYAENGFFSLAADTGSRLMAALGTALDALLFQLAVRADENAGRSAAQAQVARNMAIVFAALTPAAVGFWMVLPSLEALVAPAEFRGPFRHYLELLLPGLFFQGLAAFAVAAVFQIDKRTTPIVAAAALGCIVNAALMFTLPHGADGTMAAIAQSSAYVAAFFCLLGFAIVAGAQMPPLRDVALTIVGVVVMGAALCPLRSWEPGVVTILAQVGLGGAVYVAVVLAFDVAGLRTALRSVLDGARRR